MVIKEKRCGVPTNGQADPVFRALRRPQGAPRAPKRAAAPRFSRSAEDAEILGQWFLGRGATFVEKAFFDWGRRCGRSGAESENGRPQKRRLRSPNSGLTHESKVA